MNYKNLHTIINEEIQNVLDETYKSVDEIKKLANNILITTAEKNFEKYNTDGSFRYIYGVNVDQMDSNKYDEIKNYVIESNVQIYFQPKDDKGSNKADYSNIVTHKGEKYNPRTERDINLYYDYNRFKEKIDEILIEHVISRTDFYSKLYYEFYTSLVHELQHSYDDYRSGGMAYNTPENKNYRKNYYRKMENNIVRSQINDMEMYKKYLNLPHEIWARFSQAMIKVHFYTWDIDKSSDTQIIYSMYPLKQVLNDFRYAFDNFKVLSPETQKRLYRKVSQFWHIEQEKINELNKNGGNKP